MLSYRHLFHAGNFADVFKHALLTRLILLLQRKEKPFLYLDTHAGIGRYDLSHPWAKKLAEYHDGIERVWQAHAAPELLAPYLDAVRAENPNGKLRYYPGSPRIARRLLREDDRMVLNELNSEDCATLSKLFATGRGVVVTNEDGYHALRAHLPPKERRALIFIDSAFDRAHEFARLVQALASAHRRFATGVYVLWYPLMAAAAMHAFDRAIIATGIPKILKLELSAYPDQWSASLRGCGILVVNPPFGFEEEGQALLGYLAPVLGEAGHGSYRVRWMSSK